MPGARMPHFWEHNPLFLTICQFACTLALFISMRFPVSPELARSSHVVEGMNTNTRMTDEDIDRGGAVMDKQALRNLYYNRKPIRWSDVRTSVPRAALPVGLPVLAADEVDAQLNVLRTGCPEFFLIGVEGQTFLVNTEGYDYVRYAARVR